MPKQWALGASTEALGGIATYVRIDALYGEVYR